MKKMPEDKEIKLYRKFTVIRNSTGIEETEEYVCLRLSKEINLDKLKEKISKIKKDTIKATTWKDVEITLFKCEFE